MREFPCSFPVNSELNRDELAPHCIHRKIKQTKGFLINPSLSAKQKAPYSATPGGGAEWP